MTGDQGDVLGRLKRNLPTGWFGHDLTPIIDSALQGPAWVLSFVYTLYAYAKLQTRIMTASDGWLDLIAQDFFGASIVRKTYQTDASFRVTIIANLFRERATRRGVSGLLTAITGRAPTIIEPANPNDCGAVASPLSAGYCGVARCGSLAVPFTAMVIAYRPAISGGLAGGAYATEGAITGLGSSLSMGFMGSLSLLTSSATDADIYAAVDSVRPVGTTIWTAITNNPAALPGPGYWPGEFRLDISTLGGTDVLG